MTEPAKVHKVHNAISSVEIAVPPKSFIINGYDYANQLTDVSFSTRRLPLRRFGKQMTVEHASYYEMSHDILRLDYQEFYDGLVDNCKDLFIQDPKFDVYYDAFQHKDIISWAVYAGSDQIEFFKDLFTGPPEIREVEIEIPVYPQTLRECFKQMWVIIKKRFKR